MKPFFIVGAPRSGTTMLRDLFKQVPELYSPEETHFFRWAAPYRGNEYNAVYANNKILKLHREIDEVSDSKFQEIYEVSNSKADLTINYCQYVAEQKGAKTWFEKSPQNIYGLPLIAAQMPDVKIINIVRHPYDVVKSLLVGKVIKVDDVVGAANYWKESIEIANVVRPFLGERIIDISYEMLVENPEKTMKELLNFISLSDVNINTSHLKGRTNDYRCLLDVKERQVIDLLCGTYMKQYNYELTTIGDE